jgi:hypothetical protein
MGYPIHHNQNNLLKICFVVMVVDGAKPREPRRGSGSHTGFLDEMARIGRREKAGCGREALACG